MRALIAIPVFNRRRVAEVCLPSIYRHRGKAVVHVYNDQSTEFAGDVLRPYCDELVELPPEPPVEGKGNSRGLGVHRLRWHQFRDFLSRPEFDYLYFTDSDAFHDPSFMDVLGMLAATTAKSDVPLPVCLYNSVFHDRPEMLLSGGERLLIRKTAPGISHLYDRRMVERIVHGLDQQPAVPDYHWDFVAPALLGRPFLTTRTSYLEHFGAVYGSMHTMPGDWDRDRALNPTPYLAARRQRIIDYLEGKTAVVPAR